MGSHDRERRRGGAATGLLDGPGYGRFVVSPSPQIPLEVVGRLRCPTCGTEMTVGGGLSCAAGHRVETADGYLDFGGPSPDEATARTLRSFGYEWQAFDVIQPEDEAFWRWYFQDVPLDRLAGAVALDAGCGKGRYSTFTALHVGALVALDGSDAVVAAVRNLAHHPNVVVVRSDLRTAPFADGSFGFISCLGVLHHLPDPAEGFRSLTRLLEPGGVMLIYVYSRPTSRGVRAAGLRGAAALRRVTTRMPHAALRWSALPIAAALWLGFVAPGQIGARLHLKALERLPLGTYRGRPFRSLWLDTFDRLSAPLEARYAWPDLQPWFEEAGLDVMTVRDDAGLFVVAERPFARVRAGS